MPSWRASRKLAERRRSRGGGPRIYDPRERIALAVFDKALRAVAPLLGWMPEGGPFPAPRHILVLRLDRIGDLLMTLPALVELRRLAPEATIELAVGSWNEELARGLPFVDRVRVVDAPWSARGGRAGWRAALRALGEGPPPDLAIDFQGDVRVNILMAASRARRRLGYGDTGGAYLLTDRGAWDESRSGYRQCFDLLARVFPAVEAPRPIEPVNFLDEADREAAGAWLAGGGLARAPRPWIGVHPSAGRAIKQWPAERFAALVDRLRRTTGGTVLLTGSPEDRALVERVAGSAAPPRPIVLTSAPSLRVFAAAVERLDLFVTGDTGPMHIAHAVRTPNVAIFGPSDPVRYGPEDGAVRWVVVREELACSPCNMIRRPPVECARRAAPECLDRIALDRVVAAAAALIGRGRRP